SFLPSGFDASDIIDTSTQHAAKGSGTIKRDGTLTGNLTATVVAVDPHGNLRIQGQKVVSVNHEDEYLVLSGTVRPVDILSDNSVLSTRIADAHISYFGRGTAGDKENVPIVQRLKDIATIEGVRANQLWGYGLVTGLNGTGDSQQAIFTVQSVLDLLRRRGVV